MTTLLEQVASRTPGAVERLIEIVHEDLHRSAEARLANSPPWRTLDPTALVNEVYIRLFSGAPPSWENRRHFMGTASIAMQRILVDRARRAGAGRRGGDRKRVPLSEDMGGGEPEFDMLELDEVLAELEARSPERALLVRLRFFAGLGDQEIAAVMEKSPATVWRLWRATKAWIRWRLGHESEDSGGGGEDEGV